MRPLLIGVGNPLRRDDGVAHAVLEHFARMPGVHVRSLQQLTPETAAEMAGYDPVIVIDADVSCSELVLRRLVVDAATAARPFTHHVKPEEVIALSRLLFGFNGQAFLCRIPVSDLGPGVGLTPRAAELARKATEEIRRLPEYETGR